MLIWKGTNFFFHGLGMFYIPTDHAEKVMRHYPAGVITSIAKKVPVAGCLSKSNSKNHHHFYKGDHGIFH